MDKHGIVYLYGCNDCDEQYIQQRQQRQTGQKLRNRLRQHKTEQNLKIINDTPKIKVIHLILMRQNSNSRKSLTITKMFNFRIHKHKFIQTHIN